MARFFKNSFSDYLITPQDSRITPQGLVLDVRLPWYRSLPLSVVMPTALVVAGARERLAHRAHVRRHRGGQPRERVVGYGRVHAAARHSVAAAPRSRLKMSAARLRSLWASATSPVCSLTIARPW